MSKEYLYAIIGSFFLGFYLFHGALRRQRRVRQIEDTPRSKLSSAPQGFVEAQGFAWPKGECPKNFKGQDLVYYSFALQREETRGSGKNRRTEWITVYSISQSDPFYLLDPTGVALVQPTQGEMNIEGSNDRLWKSLSKEEKTHYLGNIIKGQVQRFPPSTGFFSGLFADKYRIVEREMRAGCPVFVSGDFRALSVPPEKIKESGLSDFFQRIVNADTREFRNLKSVLDANGDGKVSEKEAKEGYSTAARISKQKAITEGHTERDFELHGMFQSTPDQKMLLADAHEEFLVEKLKKGRITGLVAGSAFFALGVVLVTLLFVTDADMKKIMSRGSIEKTAATEKNPSLSEREAKKQLIADLHYKCIDKDLKSCTTMVGLSQSYGLGKEYVEFYTSESCKLGANEFCPTPPRETASQKESEVLQ
jgi:hypothetical protein